LSAGDTGTNRPVVWRFDDGRPGHLHQVTGLLDALRARVALEVHTIDVRPLEHSLLDRCLARFPTGDALPAPWLLLGAGHRTHWPMLAARRAHGGRAVVLMKPTLPRRWFDLCVVPEHDGVAAAPGTLLTQGVLTRVRPAPDRDPRTALVLLGGPSRHHAWDTRDMIGRLAELPDRRPGRYWRVLVSARTPGDMIEALLQDRRLARLAFDPHDSPALPEVLAGCGEVWVSEDSVSMIYDALSCGAATGLLPVPRRRPGRVTRHIDALVAAGRLPVPGDFEPTPAIAEPLNEAARVADWITEQWLNV
jgi:mitochondrial fission protein ELM1